MCTCANLSTKFNKPTTEALQRGTNLADLKNMMAVDMSPKGEGMNGQINDYFIFHS